MEAKIGNKDIQRFQKIAKRGKVPDIISFEPQTSKSVKEAQSDRMFAEHWAQAMGADGYVSEGRDLVSRLTPIGTNLLTRDIESAVLGLLGLLETRVAQLQNGGTIYGFVDRDLETFLEALRIRKLPKDSPIFKLFEEYKELKNKNQFG
jgi:hypothetical protein